ncbi:hypothetical protein, conserved [Eimeria maxima]|uniref:Uncharacterized protein n=1 Tax=Eimeria maxima TaxID=5804 RepID=U6LZ00_EIMMA|nr:hypothetical protein, conserved [Eimeria maxima]CDJ56986.1 hypothetical protein, conserved [Eimeria maxima]
MFADENFFSPSTGSEFLSSEPRKSVGAPTGGPLGAPLGSSTHGFGMSGFGMADEFGGASEGLSQTQTGSQKTPQTAAAHTPDGCICSTIQMLRRAARERAGGGGPLQLHGREVGLVGLCGFASALEVRSSLFKFTLEDMTSAIEVECANKAVLHKLQLQMDAQEEPVATTTTTTATTTTNTELLCKRLKEGGLVSVYGFACTDDKGEVYVDCFKAAAITDPREYAQAFPFRVIAAALKAQGTNPNPALKTEGKQLHRDPTEQQTHNKQEPNGTIQCLPPPAAAASICVVLPLLLLLLCDVA